MMKAVGTPQGPVRNRLLATLSASDWEAINPLMELVVIRPRQVLQHSNLRMEYVYFIEQGLVSASARMTSDQWVEVWLLGCEGMTGIPVVLGVADQIPFRRVVLVGGTAYRILGDDLVRAAELSRDLKGLLLRYAAVVLQQASVSGACNSHHTLNQRLARWLLLAGPACKRISCP